MKGQNYLHTILLSKIVSQNDLVSLRNTMVNLCWSLRMKLAKVFFINFRFNREKLNIEHQSGGYVTIITGIETKPR